MIVLINCRSASNQTFNEKSPAIMVFPFIRSWPNTVWNHLRQIAENKCLFIGNRW